MRVLTCRQQKISAAVITWVMIFVILSVNIFRNKIIIFYDFLLRKSTSPLIGEITNVKVILVESPLFCEWSVDCG
jgi:hypothetical protein